MVGVCFSIGADCDTIETPVNPLDEPALIDEGGLLRGVVVRQAHFHSKQPLVPRVLFTKKMVPWLPIRPTRALVDAREGRVIWGGGCQREIAWAPIGTWPLEHRAHYLLC